MQRPSVKMRRLLGSKSWLRTHSSSSHLRRSLNLRTRTADLLVRADRVGDPELTFWATNQQLTIATCSADIDQIDRTFDKLGHLSVQLNLPNTSWTYAWTSAAQAIVSGDFAQAEELTRKALSIGTEASEPDAVGNFGAQLMVVNWQRGTLAEMLPLIEQVAAEFPHLPVYVAALSMAYVEAARKETLSRSLLKFSGGHSSFRLLPDRTLRV